MNRTVLYVVAAIAAASWLGYHLYRSLVPHETRLRWLVAEAADEFNDGSASGVGATLANDFHSAEFGLDRREVIGALWSRFRALRTPDGTLSLRVDCDVEGRGPRIEIKDTDPPTANVIVEAFFEELEAESWAPLGTVEVTAECRLDGGRWRFRSARVTRVDGEKPW